MTQQEFTQLTNIAITDAEFEVINAMYMCENNMNKQTFCKMFVQMNLMQHVRYVVNLKIDKMEAQRENKKAHDDLDGECRAAIDRAAKSEKDLELYRSLYNSECDRCNRMQKKLDAVKNIIEL